MKTLLVIIALQLLPTPKPDVMAYDVKEIRKEITLNSRQDCEYLQRQYGFTGMGPSFMIVGSYCINEEGE